jgi:hypothetical protein
MIFLKKINFFWIFFLTDKLFVLTLTLAAATNQWGQRQVSYHMGIDLVKYDDVAMHDITDAGDRRRR